MLRPKHNHFVFGSEDGSVKTFSGLSSQQVSSKYYLQCNHISKMPIILHLANQVAGFINTRFSACIIIIPKLGTSEGIPFFKRKLTSY